MNKLRNCLLLLASAINCFWSVSSAFSQEANTQLSSIQQESPSFLVNASVNRESRDYRQGDTLSVTLVSEIDAYVYVIYEQVDGKAYQVFPNVAQPNNRVSGKQPVTIPGEEDRFRWRIAAPFGEETVKVIASEQPIDALAQANMRSKRFNSVSAAQLKDISAQLGTKGIRLRIKPDVEPSKDESASTTAESKFEELPELPDDPGFRWAETEIRVTTYPRNQELEAAGGKRFAVFFGVSEHRYAEQEAVITESSPNLSSPFRDALVLAEVMDDIGDIDEAKVFINEQATRQNFELAITDWLAKVSSPGDAVFIYFSGHGGLVADDNGDEADQQDEFLVPHDYLGLAAVFGMLKQEEQGQLAATYEPVLQSARNLIQNSGSAEKAFEKLVRATAVTDDVFGHWLQALSGRDVVVILDLCYAGGFAAAEKGIKGDQDRAPKTGEVAARANAARQFDFLDRELTRLKDIGQDNTALLTASTGDELSLVRPDGVLSVMTHELVEALRNARGPMDIDQAYSQVQQQIADFFASPEFQQINEGREEPLEPHHPLLFKPTTQQFWLKP